MGGILMFVDFEGNELAEPALVFRNLKDGCFSVAIWWNKVPVKRCPAWMINEVLEELDIGL